MFRKQILTILAAVVLFGAVNVRAVGNWDIYSDAEIHEGDEYWNVGVYDTPPDHTTLDMYGGLVDGIVAFDESTVNISGGYISTLRSAESSIVNAFGGTIGSLEAWDTGTVNVWGDADVDSLGARESGAVNMSGGVVDHIGAREFGTLNLSGGLVSDRLWAGDSTIVNIYGYDLVKTGSGGTYGYGQVYGFWPNDIAFTIDLSGPETYSHIVLIPEPATILLIFAGSLFLRRWRK